MLKWRFGTNKHVKRFKFDENVRFDAITDITLTLAGTESGHHIELRKGSNTGLLLGTHITISTGDNTTFANAVVNLSTTATGIDDLVVTIAPGYGSNASAANIDSITLAALDPIVIDDEEEDEENVSSFGFFSYQHDQMHSYWY